jgi:hypothetical protein
MRRQTQRRKRGGFPGKYYGIGGIDPSAPTQNDVLKYGTQYARPAISATPMKGGCGCLFGKKKGGFVPSIMEPAVMGIKKFIVPAALFAGYKLINGKPAKSHRKSRKSGRKTMKHRK